MRRFSLCLAALISVALLGGAGQPAPQRLYQAYSDQEKADLDKVSAYLNGIKSLKANFVQLGPDGGMAQGELFLQKPGQIRFEYKPPSPVLIVASTSSSRTHKVVLRPAASAAKARAVPQAPAPRTAIWGKTAWDPEGAINWSGKIVSCLFGRGIYRADRN